MNEFEIVDLINSVPSEEKKRELVERFSLELKFNKLDYYKPYGHPETLMPDGRIFKERFERKDWTEWSNKPWQLDFHNAGRLNQERMIMAANRDGKTFCGSFEVAYHMTGRYPDWWEGKTFDHPVLIWTGSPTNETSRDIVQKALLGGITNDLLGSGSIPREMIVGKPRPRQAGVSDVIDLFKVRHSSGGVSTCIMKTYEQGWRKWQGTAPHMIWMDEEPEDNEVQGRIYTEALTRLLTSHGLMLVTFTPLLGQTTLVIHYQEGGAGIYLDGATWNDAPHLNREERERLAASYPDHEVQARTQGVPMMGEGRIFQVPEDEITINPFPLPDYFARIKGIDFGIDHPAGMADMAWDRDKDIIYVIRTWRKSGADAATHAEAINKVDPWVPVAWPHDGANREKGSGKVLKDSYKSRDVRLLSRSARYDNDKGGGQPQWPIIKEIQEREEIGGFKVFSTCIEYLEERRNFHTKGGQIMNKRDDVLKSVMYGVMMKRFAMMRGRRGVKQAMPMAMRA